MAYFHQMFAQTLEIIWLLYYLKCSYSMMFVCLSDFCSFGD